MSHEKVLLIIRDGWGYRPSHTLNAIYSAKTPYTNYLMKNYPNILINACGEFVGLPKGFQGNSEVGHMTIGSGRILNQSLSRINQSIEDKTFFKNKSLLNAIKNCKKYNSTLHIMGLLQIEGVHSHLNHLYALLKLCEKEKFHDVKLHIFTDGRDSPANTAKKRIKELSLYLKRLKFGEIATIIGRYYAMDRDCRWVRTKLAYDAIMNGTAKSFFTDENKCIADAYKNKETDEFLKPKIKKNYTGVKNNDSMIFFNFRTDRPRQLTKAIVENKFDGFKRNKKKVIFVAMTDYYSPMNCEIAFKEIKVKNNLGEVVAKNNLKQLRISETEKYAHVTFFFNSQEEKPNKNEYRILVHSPKVATYDLKPEMSVYEIKNHLVKEMKKEKYELIVTNLVNGDMVGHTGKTKPIIKGLEAIDSALKDIVTQALKSNYTCLIFADHGNAEDQRPQWKTSHTINPVPFIVVSKEKKKLNKIKNPSLKDIAPTTLQLLGIKIPKEMAGHSLVK